MFRLIGKEDVSGAEKPAAEFGPKVKGPAQCINDRTGQVHVQLVRDDSRHYTLKVTNATECSQASTVVNVDQVCAKSGAFQRFELASEFLTTAQAQGSALYEADAEFSSVWAESGDVRWGYFTHNKLSYKESPTGPRLFVPLGANKVSLLEQVHDSRMAAHCGRHRTLARATAAFYWPGMYVDCQGREASRDGQSPSFVGTRGAMPCRKTDTARETAQHFIHNVVRLHAEPSPRRERLQSSD